MELVERGFKHPTGMQPKSVIVVGLGPSHHDYDQAWLQPHTPDWLWQADEVWGINRGMFNIVHDLAFVMDYVEGEALRFPVYGAKLYRHHLPIITSQKPEGWPDHIHQFPFEEIWTWMQSWPKFSWTDIYGIERESIGAPAHCDWYHNSLAYVFTYAAWLGVKTLYTPGLDYHHHQSGRVEDGHPNVAYWVGAIERCGVKVIPTDNSTFLGANRRGYIYGYEEHMDPRPLAVSRRAMFRRLAELDPKPDEGAA